MLWSGIVLWQIQGLEGSDWRSILGYNLALSTLRHDIVELSIQHTTGYFQIFATPLKRNSENVISYVIRRQLFTRRAFEKCTYLYLIWLIWLCSGCQAGSTGLFREFWQFVGGDDE